MIKVINPTSGSPYSTTNGTLPISGTLLDDDLSDIRSCYGLRRIKNRKLIVVLGMLVLALIIIFGLWTPNQINRGTHSGIDLVRGTEAPKNETKVPLPIIDGDIKTDLEYANERKDVITKEVITKALVSWVKEKENTDVFVLDTDEILDVSGAKTAMNIICTTNPELRDISGGQFRKKVALFLANDAKLKTKMAKEHTLGNARVVNGLMKRIVEEREEFSQSNGLATYRVSLTERLPPVLSYWPGLPWELSRYEESKTLAEKELGEPVSKSSLVYYTVVSSIISFSTAGNKTVHVDPYNMQVVRLSKGGNGRNVAQRKQAEDRGKSARIAKQWDEFLIDRKDLP